MASTSIVESSPDTLPLRSPVSVSAVTVLVIELTIAVLSSLNKIPFLGICLGLQVAVIEFARNMAQMDGANSTEFDEVLESTSST